MAKAKKTAEASAAPAPATRRHWAAALLLALVFAGRLLHRAALESPSYDEATYLVYGHALWETGDFRLSIDKPPLVPWVAGLGPKLLGASFDRDDADWKSAGQWIGAPTPWANGLQDYRWRFFLKDLHHNKVPEERLLFWGRAGLILLNAAALLGAFTLAAPLLGAGPALGLVFFASLSPNLLAHAGVVGEDATVASFILLAVLAFLRLLDAPSPESGAVFGALTAAALLSKHSALTLGPAYVLLMGAAWGLGVLPRDREGWKRLLLAFAAAAGALVAVFLVLYLGVNLRFYWLSIHNTLLYQARGQATYCLGTLSPVGFWYYYLVCLGLKVCLPLLVLPAVWLARRSWPKRDAWLTAAFLTPAAVLLGFASHNKIQLGLRYVLPVVPLLAALSAAAAARRPWLGALLGAWMGLASFAAHPHYLAYFNLLGGMEPWRLLSDSNVDWGQDLWALRDYVRASGADEVILSYYGDSLVESVGFPFQDLYSFGVWGDKGHVAAMAPKKELLAVSATNRVGLYLARVTGARPFAWLDARKPEAVLGGSIFVFDVTQDAEAHAQLAKLYAEGGFQGLARREAARAEGLDPSGAALKLVFGAPVH